MRLKRKVRVVVVSATVVLFLSLWLINRLRHCDECEELMSVNFTETECITGTPCTYVNQVALRVIVITSNRSRSLVRLLESLDGIELDGDSGSLDIFVDCDERGLVDPETVKTAYAFHWRRGLVGVHLQTSHAGANGQWIDAWRPATNDTKEIVLILEDGMSVSKYCYRWIKAVHGRYGDDPDFAGTTLTIGRDGFLNSPGIEPVYMYGGVGTWGFSPKASVWRGFQDWFHAHSRLSNFRPHVPEAAARTSGNSGDSGTTWEQWFNYYTFKEKLFVVYSNLKSYSVNHSSCFCTKYRVSGLHVPNDDPVTDCKLIKRWDDGYIKFPENITRFDWDGNRIGKY